MYTTSQNNMFAHCKPCAMMRKVSSQLSAKRIVKDVEDIGGDREEGLNTLPIAIGERRALLVALIVLAVAGFTALTCIPAIGGIELDFGAIIRNWSNGSGILVQFLQPDFSFLPRTIGPMLETLQMAVVGAFLAALVVEGDLVRVLLTF